MNTRQIQSELLLKQMDRIQSGIKNRYEFMIYVVSKILVCWNLEYDVTNYPTKFFHVALRLLSLV